jgi:hypothetical protein
MHVADEIPGDCKLAEPEQRAHSHRADHRIANKSALHAIHNDAPSVSGKRRRHRTMSIGELSSR